MLQGFNRGLIALSGCRKGELTSLIEKGKLEEAQKIAYLYREVFGKDFFIELIRYPSREGFYDSYQLASFAKEEGFPVVATNNVHYAELKEYRVKELLNAIDQNITIFQLQGYRTVEQYLKSPKEMMRLFKDLPEAIDATTEIASRCNLELEPGKPHFPKFDTPKGETDYGYLSKLAFEGAIKKYGSITPKIRNRLEGINKTWLILIYHLLFYILLKNIKVKDKPCCYQKVFCLFHSA